MKRSYSAAGCAEAPFSAKSDETTRVLNAFHAGSETLQISRQIPGKTAADAVKKPHGTIMRPPRLRLTAKRNASNPWPATMAKDAAAKKRNFAGLRKKVRDKPWIRAL